MVYTTVLISIAIFPIIWHVNDNQSQESGEEHKKSKPEKPTISSLRNTHIFGSSIGHWNTQRTCVGLDRRVEMGGLMVERYEKLGLKESLSRAYHYPIACEELSCILRNAYSKVPKNLQSLIFQDSLAAFRLLPQ